MRNERITPMPLQIGMYVQTPFSPNGLVEVVGIEDHLHPLMPRQTVLVRFLDRHPLGYPASTLGRYFRDELCPAGKVPPLSPPYGRDDGIPGCP